MAILWRAIVKTVIVARELKSMSTEFQETPPLRLVFFSLNLSTQIRCRVPGRYII